MNIIQSNVGILLYNIYLHCSPTVLTIIFLYRYLTNYPILRKKSSNSIKTQYAIGPTSAQTIAGPYSSTYSNQKRLLLFLVSKFSHIIPFSHPTQNFTLKWSKTIRIKVFSNGLNWLKQWSIWPACELFWSTTWVEFTIKRVEYTIYPWFNLPALLAKFT